MHACRHYVIIYYVDHEFKRYDLYFFGAEMLKKGHRVGFSTPGKFGTVAILGRWKRTPPYPHPVLTLIASC